MLQLKQAAVPWYEGSGVLLSTCYPPNKPGRRGQLRLERFLSEEMERKRSRAGKVIRRRTNRNKQRDKRLQIRERYSSTRVIRRRRTAN